MIYGYIQVLTRENDTVVQYLGEVDVLVEERLRTRKDGSKIELRRLLQKLTVGDELIIHSFDRVAVTTRQLLRVIENVLTAGASLYFVLEDTRLEPSEIPHPFQSQFIATLKMMSVFERKISHIEYRKNVRQRKEVGQRFGRYPNFNYDRALELLESGYTVREISEKLGVPCRSIYYLRKKHFASIHGDESAESRLGFQREQNRRKVIDLLDAGWTVNNIAEHLKMSMNTVYYIRREIWKKR